MKFCFMNHFHIRYLDFKNKPENVFILLVNA